MAVSIECKSGRRSRMAWALATLAILATGVGILCWQLLGGPGPTADRGLPAVELPSPQVTYQGPYLNVRPEVRYVGDDKACANCHREIANAYKQSAMGQSLRPVAEVAASQRYDESAHNPFDLQGYRFSVERKGDRVWHRQTRTGPDGALLLDFSLEAQYAIGSGTRGYSYITDRDGFLFQTPISWFSQKGIWDKSPGFEADRFAGRPIGEACLYCHANHAPLMEDYANRYDRPFKHGYTIGCERCHGPGEKHIREGGLLADGFDPTIVNPAKLEHGLREAVCQQCHLEGKARVARHDRRFDEFRPGLPLQSVLTVFVVADDAGVKAVSHVEQMYHSRCFVAGADGNKMGCISCHDPHRRVPADERVAFYRGRCLQCHEPHACSAAPAARKEKSDSCVDCHMPRFQATDIVHTAATDHRVIRPGKTPSLAPGKGAQIEAFFSRRVEKGDRELSRDLGLALAESFSSDQSILERAVGLLERAGEDFPGDVEVLETHAAALLSVGRFNQAVKPLQTLLEKHPRRETVLIRYATACEVTGQEQAALDAWRRAAEVNPWTPVIRQHLTSLLAKTGAWAECLSHAEAWLRLDPSDVKAHKSWIAALSRNGRRGEARIAFEHARALFSFNRAELQAWFEEIQP
jgi:predicted CXXCH cytochrome family protein